MHEYIYTCNLVLTWKFFWMYFNHVHIVISSVVYSAASFEQELEIHSNIMLLLRNNGRKDRPEDYPAWQYMVGLLMWHGYVDTTAASIFAFLDVSWLCQLLGIFKTLVRCLWRVC